MRNLVEEELLLRRHPKRLQLVQLQDRVNCGGPGFLCEQDGKQAFEETISHR